MSMAGSELPLITYAKLHKTLSETLGEDDSAIESFRMPNFQLLHRLTKNAQSNCTNCASPNNTAHNYWKKQPPLEFLLVNPMNNSLSYTIQIYKGLRSVILSAKDADFMVNRPVGKQLYKWLDGSHMTEEHFYSSLIRIKVNSESNLIVQDRYKSSSELLHGLCIRYTHWYYGVRMGGVTYSRKACFGTFIHAICNFNVFDLDKLKEASEKCIIGNKFSLKIDSSAVLMHLINMLSRSFDETGDKYVSKTVKQYHNGSEMAFERNFHARLKQLLN